MSFESVPTPELSATEKAFFMYQKYFQLSPEDLSKSLLDIGAGSGDFIKHVRETLGNKNAYGIEKQKSKIENKEGLFVADGAHLPFDDESFEIVIAKKLFPYVCG